MCLRASVHMCSAGPEVAVLDCYGPEADPAVGYWQRGRGVAGLQVVCEAHIQGAKSCSIPPRIFWGDFRHSYTDHFSIIIISSPSAPVARA